MRLELSETKTLITHARSNAARFLGYEVVALHADEKHDQRGQRIINGLVRLKVPTNVIVERCRRYMRNGKAAHRPERLHDDDFSIVSQYGAEYRGFVQYYLLAFNAHRLRRVHRVMQTSLLGTIANKHKTRIAPIYPSAANGGGGPETDPDGPGRYTGTARGDEATRGHVRRHLVGMEEGSDFERPPASDLQQRS